MSIWKTQISGIKVLRIGKTCSLTIKKIKVNKIRHLLNSIRFLGIQFHKHVIGIQFVKNPRACSSKEIKQNRIHR